MKNRHLLLNCLFRLTIIPVSVRAFWKMKFFLLLLLLAACTSKPKDGGTSLPPPLYPQPQSFAANPEGGYVVNQVTGDTIKPIINSFGDTVLTGVLIPVTPRLIHPDSVTKPKVVKVPALANLEKHNAHPNRHKVPENLTTIPVDLSQLKRVKFGEGDQDFVLKTSTGDTIPTGVSIPAHGVVIKTIHSQPIKALPLAFKDAANAHLQYLDVDQGMISSYVLSIIEDKNGNLWFGTSGGVSVYNGENFRHFTEKEGLRNNYIRSVLEDKNGNIWFGTGGGGVSVYNGESFSHFTVKEGLCHNGVSSILEDRNGNIWIGTSGGGVSVYNGESFRNFTVKEGLSSNAVNSIMEDKNGNIWIGTSEGISVYHAENLLERQTSFSHFTEKDGLKNNLVITLMEDKNRNIWIGTGGGLSVFSLNSAGGYKADNLSAGQASFKHVQIKEALSKNAVISILEDKNGNIWFGTIGGGVSLLALSDEGYHGENLSAGQASFIHFTEKEGLSNNFVWSILEDKSGNIWFGTGGGGVSVYHVESYSHFTEKEGLSNNAVNSIMEDKNGNIWFGTQLGGGVSVYNGESFFHFTEKDGLGVNFVLSILEDKNGNIWFGSTDGVRVLVLGSAEGYAEESLSAGKASIRHFTVKEGLCHNFVRSILEDKFGNIWIATNGGVSLYNGESFSHFTIKEGLSHGVSSILEDKNGNIWLGTLGGGVIVYNGDSLPGGQASFRHFTEKEGLSHNAVTSLLEDKNGNIWIGTNVGVSIYNGESLPDGQASFRHFTEKEGLSHNVVRSILEDKNSNIWIGTLEGISRIDLESFDNSKFTIHNFNKRDGLKGLNFYPNSALKDSKNRAWWGSDKSLTMLNLNRYSTTTHPTAVFLSQLDINETFIDYRNIPDSLSKKIQFSGVEHFENYPLNLILPYDKNHLTFHFAGIDWAAPHKIKYSYRMLGLSDHWSVPSKEAKAEYRNLPFGSYTFQIRAIGESLEWSEPFEYSFIINPPWWRTWWAYTIYIIILGFLIWKIHVYQKNATIEKERVKTRERELQQAKEIEKAYTQLKATQTQLIHSEKMASLGELTAGIAHEIKNPLNFVNNFSEVSIEMVEEAMEEIEKKQEVRDEKIIRENLVDIKTNLQKVHEHGTRANSIVTSMLQHSRSSSGKMEPTDLNALVSEFTNLSYHGMRAGKKPISVDLQLDLDPNLEMVPLIKEDFSRVIINLCNNAFDALRMKIAADISGIFKAKLIAKTTQSVNSVKLSIQDNGPGIPDEIKDKIMQPFFTTKKGTEGTGLGLSITSDIIKAHGGTLTIGENQSQSGTTFIVTIPLKHE